MKALVINDGSKWNKTISGFTEKDVYFFHGYFIPFKNYGDGEPQLFYFESENGKIAYPFMLRDISKSKNLKNKIESSKYFDISSVYGYGGPLFELSAQCKDIEVLKKEFFSTFSNYCKSNNIISQFDRFNPLLKNHLFFKGYSELAQIRKTVHIDLTDKETLWNNMESKCRQMIRKAKKNNVTVEFDFNCKTLDVFQKIYQTTMLNNSSNIYYLFNDNFYKDTIEYLPENSFLANAIFENQIIASILIVKSDKYLHGHLGGTDYEYRNLQPTSLLYYEIANWGNENGLEKFHVGGGYKSETDSLYRFKKTFNKSNPNDFYIGKIIHNEKKYNDLVLLSGNENTESSYFPKYRI